MLREITITLLILAVCTTSLYSQNIKNKEDMQKVFETFALSTQDLDQSVKGFEAIVHTPIYPFAEILENQNISDKEDYIWELLKTSSNIYEKSANIIFKRLHIL